MTKFKCISKVAEKWGNCKKKKKAWTCNHSSTDNLLASRISPYNKFVAFLILYKVTYTHRAVPICEINFCRFSLKNLWTKNIKIHYKTFWVHRVYGMQNDRLDLRIKDFFFGFEKNALWPKILEKRWNLKKLNREYLRLRCTFLKTEKKFLILRSSRSFWIP